MTDRQINNQSTGCKRVARRSNQDYETAYTQVRILKERDCIPKKNSRHSSPTLFHYTNKHTRVMVWWMRILVSTCDKLEYQIVDENQRSVYIRNLQKEAADRFRTIAPFDDLMDEQTAMDMKRLWRECPSVKKVGLIQKSALIVLVSLLFLCCIVSHCLLALSIESLM